jgi:predicted metal-dependent enzyme (double-stranded beta helix superfamily)
MGSMRAFRDFIQDMTAIAGRNLPEAVLLADAKQLMGDLLAKDDWLPDMFARPDETHYRQYLLHCDPLERFSIVSFVWAPGQETPIHDHTVWGLLGVLRGSEVSQRYEQGDGAMHAIGGLETLDAGAIDMVSPTIGDIHKVRNDSRSRTSVSIHLYGGNIGAINRHSFTTDGAAKQFRSGYTSDVLPNIWRI